MPQLSKREIRNSLVLLVGLATVSLGASVWFCEIPKAQTSGNGLVGQDFRPWQPVMAGIELASGGHKIEWAHPEDEVKTERSKLLKGLEASF